MHIVPSIALLSLLSTAIACKSSDKPAHNEAKATSQAPHAQAHSSAEPIGKAYLKHEVSSDVQAGSLGISDGIFVWSQWKPDRSFELFAVTLAETWAPVSLGTHTGGSQVLVGPYLLRIDEDDAVWTAKLPDGPLAKTDLTIAERNLLYAVVDQSHMVMLVDSGTNDARVVEMSTGSGEFTVSAMPPLPSDYMGAVAKAVDGDTVLVQASRLDESEDGVLGGTNFYFWLDRSTGQYSKYGPEFDADGNGISIASHPNGILVNKELYQNGKKVPGGQELAKTSWDHRCRLRQRLIDGEPGQHFIGCSDAAPSDANAIAEPVADDEKNMRIVSDSNWVVWNETWGGEGAHSGFFAAPRK